MLLEAAIDESDEGVKLTEISQAKPSAMAQNKLLAKAYSRRLAKASSSTSKAEMLAN
jgi:hypothetical protein